MNLFKISSFVCEHYLIECKEYIIITESTKLIQGMLPHYVYAYAYCKIEAF